MATIIHAKTNNITDITDAEYAAEVVLGNYPVGTTKADITLPSDWNDAHTINLTNAQIIVGNASNIGAGVAVSGDATLTNAGALTVTKTNGVNFAASATTDTTTSANITDSSNKRFVTDAQLVVIGNTSGTNSGDQTSIVGITGTKAQFDTACTDGNFLYVGDVSQYTDEMAQDAIGAMINTSLTYIDGTPSLGLTSRTIGGVAFDGTANIVPQTIQSINEATDTTCFPLFISASGTQSLQPLNNTALKFNSNTGEFGSTSFTGAGTGLTGTAASLRAGTVTNATFTTALTVNTGTLTLTANAANTSVLTIGAGAVSVSGANTGDQTITLTGAVNGTGTGSFATSLGSFTSADLLAALTNETGTGLAVFGTAPTFASTITVGTAAGTTGAVLLRGTTSGTVTLSVADAAGTWTMKLPTSAGSNTNVLTTDGSGNTSWTAAGSGDMTLAGVQTVTGAKTFGTIGGAVGKLILAGSTSGSTILNAAAVAGTTTVTLPGSTDTLVGLATTDTLTNKRITRRVVTVNAPGATPTTNTDNCDIAAFTGLAAAITSMTTNLSGTPVAGDLLMFQFTDNGTARAITWGASFAATTVALPTTTVISTLLRVGFQWSGSLWQCIAVA